MTPAERQRSYRERHHDRCLAREAAYRAAHGAERRAAWHRWAEDKREDLNRRSRERYAADPEKYREIQTAHYLANLEQRRAEARARAKVSRPARTKAEKASGSMAARSAVAKALRAGRIKRDPCVVCGAAIVQAHHHLGYAREHRLDVQWLCPDHHTEAHHPGSLDRRARALRRTARRMRGVEQTELWAA